MNNKIELSISAIRKNLKMNQHEFAEAVGVSTATVTNWETGRSEPRLSQLRSVSELSGVPMDNIFCPLNPKK